MEELEKELATVKADYIKTKNNIKIYTARTALKNNALRTAIVNRKKLKRNANAFKYDSKSKYMIRRNYEKELKVRKTHSQKQMDESLRLIVEIVENLEMDIDFLKDTSFVVSPYAMDGINAYTMTKSSGDSLIVISSQNLLAPKDFIDRSIKSTILHEIGHVFFNKNHGELKKSNLNIERDVNLRADDLDQWEKSPTENFAEDFRIFASSRLGNKSFKPMKKKTLLDTNQKEFRDTMESILK